MIVLKQFAMAVVLVKVNTVASKVIVAVPGVIPVAPRVSWKLY